MEANCDILNQYKVYLMLILPVFIINPTIGIIVSALLLLYSNHKDNLLNPFFILLSVWLSLINVTKIPAGDQLGYLQYFNQARDMDMVLWWREVTGGSMKEPLFYLFTYFSQYFFAGQSKIYFFFLSLINYVLLFITTAKLAKAVNAGFIYAFTGIIISAFFTQYFSLTLHVVRQIIACTLVLYGIVLRAIDGRPHYVVILCAVLVHTSVAFLAILGCIPWFYNKLKRWQIMICSTILVLFILLFGTIGKLLLEYSGEGVTSYAFSRMKDDATDGSGEVSLLLLLIILVPMIFISLKLVCFDLPRNRYKLVSCNGRETSPFYPIAYIFIILSGFILGMSGAPLIQYRFAMMSYTFIPIIIPYLFYKTNVIKYVYLPLICIFFIVRFFIYHNVGTFKYAPISDLILNTLPHYFIK